MPMVRVSNGGTSGIPKNHYLKTVNANAPTLAQFTVGTTYSNSGSALFEIINVEGYSSLTLTHSSTNGMGTGAMYGIKDGVVTSIGSGTVDVTNYDLVVHSSFAGYGTCNVTFTVNS